MTRIEITRGTNPTIKVRVKDVTLVPTYAEEIGGEEVVRHSYFTVRLCPDPTKAIDPAKGELQIEMDGTGEVIDTLGNRFTIDTETSPEGTTYGCAEVRLSQPYTSTMTKPGYLCQFNLIDEDGNQFAVDPRPMEIVVHPNVIDLTEGA